MAKGDIKRRREIERLSASLPSLTSAQEWEAQQVGGVAWIGAKKGWCDVCAREFDSDLWNTKKKLTFCPHCGAKLTIKRSPNKRKEKTSYYWHIITTAGDWQVVRTFLCTREARRVDMFGTEVLNPSEVMFDAWEVFQRFFKKDEKQMIIGCGLRGMSYYSDQWNRFSEWKIRKFQSAYSIWGWMSKDQQLLPILRQRGLKKMNAECSPYGQIESVFYDEKAEILLKKKADKLFAAFINRNRSNVYSHWQTIRVALRHNYKPKDVGMWLDLLDLLRMNGKDLHNPHFICPTNLKKAHDVQHAIRERALEKQRIEKERREAARLAEKLSEDGKTNLEYVEKMGAFLGITLKLGNVILQPLQNIREFFEEGSELCHCVFTNNYYKHPDCLIIGARVDGKRTETIEIDTKNWKVVQCRGKHNQPSKYHDRILNLMNRNMYKFRNVAL
jgi:hypothetical protein